MDKIVKVNIRGVVNLPLKELNAFQEDIKVLTDENFKRMKEEILADGFSFSPHVFSAEDGTWWLLDGHQRRTCLERMEAEGYHVPLIPCMEVEAESLEHARRLVLAAASQYGTFKVAKLVEFTKKIGIAPVKTVDRFVLPVIGFEKIVKVNAHARQIAGSAEEEWKGMPEFAQADKTAYRSIHVHFANEEAVQKFAELVGHKITEKTRYLWYPEIVIDRLADKVYEGKK